MVLSCYALLRSEVLVGPGIITSNQRLMLVSPGLCSACFSFEQVSILNSEPLLHNAEKPFQRYVVFLGFLIQWFWLLLMLVTLFLLLFTSGKPDFFT